MQVRGCRLFGLILSLASLVSISQAPALAAFTTLPNSSTTPGALNPMVNQDNIHTTICRNGYTATIRPPSSYTNSLKRRQLRTLPYSNYGSTDLSLFEEDHLIPLEVGGNPTNVLNLWPEPWGGTLGAHEKDQLENKLHTLVCAGVLSLGEAQVAIATNWEVAFQRYVLGGSTSETSTLPTLAPPPVPSIAPSQPPSPPAPQSPLPSLTPITTSRPSGATGLCNDGTYSFATSHRGMCSGHRGVAQFYV